MNIKIKLAEGNSLFIPGTTTLLKPGDVAKVKKDTFWNRRVKDGSVTLVNEIKTSEINKNSEKKTGKPGKEKNLKNNKEN